MAQAKYKSCEVTSSSDGIHRFCDAFVELLLRITVKFVFNAIREVSRNGIEGDYGQQAARQILFREP